MVYDRFLHCQYSQVSNSQLTGYYMFFICVLFGYDSLAGGVVVGIEQFRKQFGVPFDGDYVVNANWQLGFLGATLGGIVLGGLTSGLIVNKVGRQITLAIFYVISIGGIFLQYYSSTPAQFFGGKILTGIPLGCFTTISPSYASEMAPLAIRGMITAGMNFAIVLGMSFPFHHGCWSLKHFGKCKRLIECRRSITRIRCHAPGKLLPRRSSIQGPFCYAVGLHSRSISYSSFLSRVSRAYFIVPTITDNEQITILAGIPWKA